MGGREQGVGGKTNRTERETSEAEGGKEQNKGKRGDMGTKTKAPERS